MRCKSKARHRIALEVYNRFLPAGEGGEKVTRVLHLAPEASLSPVLAARYGAGYVTADPVPEKYPHAKCLALYFPQDYSVFPDNYFSVILHNHVLEHIPGTFRDHLKAFDRLLEPGGHMIFSVPGPYAGMPTREGGELLPTDADRLEQFLQEDHFKVFGDDFVEYVRDLPGGQLLPDGIDDRFRAKVSVRPGKARFFVWKKESEIEA